MLPNEATKTERQELLEFYKYMYQDKIGITYIALKSPNKEQASFTQHFFEYPAELPAMVDLTLEKRHAFEVYYAPAMFKTKDCENPGGKENVKGSNVYWVEFDGIVPLELPGIPEPTMRVMSSIEGHYHWYWRSDSFIESDQLERVNRALTYLLGADTSGWDANQILRPIHTKNHKRNQPVIPKFQNDLSVNASLFAGLPEPPPVVDVPVPESIPQVEDVIAKYVFNDVVWQLFTKGRPEGQRSEGEMALGYYLAEMGMSDGEIFSVLLNADMRWGKFKDRADQLQRLAEIVTIARVKYPVGKKHKDAELVVPLENFGLLTFLSTEYHFEWIWEGFLQNTGYCLLTGPSGVGKTQFSLNAGMSIALGQDFLERKIESPKKVGFLSLEMGGPDLQFFLQKQAATYSNEQKLILQENFIIAPVGEPIYMDTPAGQETVIKWITENNLDGIIIDSLGSSMAGDVSSEGAAKNIMSWCDHIRQEFGIFVLFIHHHRKATGDNKKPNKLQDVYGSMFLTARATSVFCLWDVGIMNTLQVIPLKMRLSPDKEPFNIYRGSDLKFTKKGEGITIVKPLVSPHEAEESVLEKASEEGPDAGTGMSI